MSDRPTYTVTLTAGQAAALSFAALCESESLRKGRERHEPEVQEAVSHLQQARLILEQAQGRQP